MKKCKTSKIGKTNKSNVENYDYEISQSGNVDGGCADVHCSCHRSSTISPGMTGLVLALLLSSVVFFLFTCAFGSSYSSHIKSHKNIPTTNVE